MNTRRLVAILTVLTSSLVARPDETYRINLSPPAHPGQKFHYVASHFQQFRQSVIFPDQTSRILSEVSITTDLDALVDVLRCDRNGRPAKLHFTIDRFVGGPPGYSEILPKGSAFDADYGRSEIDSTPRDRFTPSNFHTHLLLSGMLRNLITIGNEKEPTEQQLFGTEDRFPLGGSWSLNGEPGVHLLAKMGVDAEPSQVTGHGVLKGIENVGSDRCLKVELKVDSIRPEQTDDMKRSLRVEVTGQLIEYISIGSGIVRDASYEVCTHVDVTREGSNHDRIARTATTIRREIQLQELPAGR